MKLIDYIRLSIKNNKNKTSIIIRILLIFSMLFISLAVFFILTMDVSIKNEFKGHKEISCVNIDLSDDLYSLDYASYVSNDYKNDLISLDGVSDYITNDCYEISSTTSKSKMIIDEEEYTLDKKVVYYTTEENEYSPGYIPFNIIDKEMTSSIFIDADYDYSSNPLLAGNEFSSNSAGEIMLSSAFLDAYNIDYNNCIGKSITLQSYINKKPSSVSSSTTAIDSSFFNEYVYSLVTIINEFTIVGVFDANIYKSEARYSESNNLALRNSYFWITTDSYSTSSGACPELLTINDSNVYYYSNTISEMEDYCNDNRCILLLLGSTVKHSYNYYDLDRSHMIIQFKSFDALWKVSYKIDDLYRKSTTYASSIDVTNECYNELYGDYTAFYPIYYYSTLLISIFAITLLVVSIIILVNMCNHNINMKKGYIAMLSSMGYKRKNLDLMLLSDVGYISLFSLIATFILGTISSIAISAVLNKFILNLQSNDLLTINISFEYAYYLLAFAIVGLIIIVISFIISSFLNFKCRKINIVKINNEN